MTAQASTDSGQYLPDIHRYCHRFCERCPLTQACAFYAEIKPQRAALGSLAFADIEEVFADYPALLADQLVSLEGLARRIGSRSLGERRRLRLKPPLSFPLTERSGVLLRRLKRFESEALARVGQWLNRLEATYLTLGQVTVDSRRLLSGHEAFMSLGWYRAIFPVRLRRALEALWLERRDPAVSTKARLLHEATGMAMSADESLAGLTTSIETLMALYPELATDGGPVLEEIGTLRRTIAQLAPQVFRLRRHPHWWVSWGAQASLEAVLSHGKTLP